MGHQLLGDIAGQRFGAGQGRRRRQEVGVDHVALVLARHQGRRHPAEQHQHQRDHRGEQQQPHRRALEEEAHAGAVAVGQALEQPVEGAQRRRRLMLPGLEQQRAERRAQGQGDDAGDHHRHGDGDRELLVHLPGQAAEETHRHEHRTEHQDDGDDRPGHLLHGLDGRLPRAQLVAVHHPLDVLDHHDGVVHHDADGQHHAEQGQQVDREAQQVEAGEGADQRHRDRQHRDQRGAPVLQEQEDHQHHQHQGLEEGVDHLLDRHLDELGGVVGDLVGDALGKLLRQARQGVAHRLGGVQGVGARLQVDAEGGVLLAVERGHQRVVLGAQLDPRHVLEQQAGAGGVRAQDHALELRRVGEAALGGHRVGEVLLLLQRLLAEAAGGELRVLLADRRDHVAGGQVELRQLVRAQPDAHGVVLGAELAGIADPGQALEFVDDVDQRIVADIHRVARTVGGEQVDHLEDVRGLLLHLDPLPAHLFRQLGQGRLDPVVDVDGGLVRVGADLEVHRQAHGVAAGVGLLVDHALDAVDRLFQGRGHGFGDHLGAGPGVAGADRHLGRQDLRVLGNGQRAHGHQAGQHDDHRDDRGEHRAVDKEA